MLCDDINVLRLCCAAAEIYRNYAVQRQKYTEIMLSDRIIYRDYILNDDLKISVENIHN